MRLRKKSETIEAIQYNGNNAQEIIDLVGDGPGANGGKVICYMKEDDLWFKDELKPGKFLPCIIPVGWWVFRREEQKHGRAGMNMTVGDMLGFSNACVGIHKDEYIQGFYEPATYE